MSALRCLLVGALAAIVGCSQEAPPVAPDGEVSHAPFELDERLLDIERTFPDYYLAHKENFRTHISQVGDLPVWLLRNLGGWAANSIVIDAPDGLIVYDTGVNRDHGRRIRAAISDISDKPVKAIIYSHHHVDHVSGTDQIVDPDAVSSGRVDIYAWHNFIREYRDENEVVGSIMGTRAFYMYGPMLPEAENVHQGCCGKQFIGGARGHLPPNQLIDRDTDLNIAGRPLTLFYTGGEAASEIGLYVPEFKLVLLGDELYPALPNLYTIRGAKFRDAQRWAAAGLRALEFDVEYLLGSHLPAPLVGREEIARVVNTYSDAVLFLHDQAVRFILKGEDAADLTQRFQSLPEFLDMDPYTRPMYGTPQYNTATQFEGYLGVHQGDALQFRATAEPERARRTVALMGGRDRVLWAAQQALADGEPQWCAELADLVVTTAPEDDEARQLKAAGLRTLGYAELNPQWRNWYLMAAMELDGSIDPVNISQRLEQIGRESGLTLRFLLDAMRYRVDVDKAGDQHIRVGFIIEDDPRSFLLTLRNSVLRVEENPREISSADVSLTSDEQTLRQVLLGEKDLRWALLTGGASLAGDTDALRDFFAVFERGVPTVYLHSPAP